MPNARAGLWENASTTVVEVGLPPNVPNAAKLPPAERARIERSLAPWGGRPVTTNERVCMSADTLDPWDTYGTGKGAAADCKRTVLQQTPQRVKMSLVCAGGRSTGDADFTAVGSDRVVGKITMLTKSERGDSKLNVQMESRWVGADCGSLKPGQRETLGAR
ncbi:MAG: DUF3617 family protein [Casimicrobiaceae bacterium]